MTEERLNDIETKISFQEDQIEELNKTIYQQQRQIAHLETVCKALAGQIRALSQAGSEGAPAHEKPPHY